MAKFKDFGSGATDLASAEPITFKLHGEEFACKKAVQGKTLLALVRTASDPVLGSEAITKFFDTVLEDESRVRFDALCNDPEKIVTVETLGEITGWLLSEYSDRPTSRPEVSPTGQ